MIKKQVLYFVMKYDIVFVAFLQIAIEHKMRSNYLLYQRYKNLSQVSSSQIYVEKITLFTEIFDLKWAYFYSLIYTFSEKKSRKSSFFIISVYKIVILFTCIIYTQYTYVVRLRDYARAIRPKNEQNKKIIYILPYTLGSNDYWSG